MCMVGGVTGTGSDMRVVARLGRVCVLACERVYANRRVAQAHVLRSFRKGRCTGHGAIYQQEKLCELIDTFLVCQCPLEQNID